MASFRSTTNPPTFRRIVPADAFLVDPTSGSPIGIQNPNANGNDGQFYPVPLSASQIASPTAAMLADINVTYCLNVAPYTRYMSDGTNLVGLDAGGGVDAYPLGIFANLATVPAGTVGLTVGPNSQAIIYSPWTIQNAGGVTVQGEVRVYAWP